MRLDSLLDEAGIEVRYLANILDSITASTPGLHTFSNTIDPILFTTHLHVLRYAFAILLLLKRTSVLHTVHNLAKARD